MDGRAQRPARWWERVVPVSLLAALAAFAVLSVAGGEEQVRLSTSRQQQEFVELQLTRTPDQVCRPRKAVVGFAVRSHLAETARLPWRVSVTTTSKKQTVRKGIIEVQPTVVREARATLRVPRSASYDVTVALPGRPESLRVHCGGAR